MFNFRKNETKKEKMLRYLMARKNKWCNWWKLVSFVKTLHHTELIRQLRKEYTIKNRTTYNNGTTHTEYKLVI